MPPPGIALAAVGLPGSPGSAAMGAMLASLRGRARLHQLVAVAADPVLDQPAPVGIAWARRMARRLALVCRRAGREPRGADRGGPAATEHSVGSQHCTVAGIRSSAKADRADVRRRTTPNGDATGPGPARQPGCARQLLLHRWQSGRARTDRARDTPAWTRRPKPLGQPSQAFRLPVTVGPGSRNCHRAGPACRHSRGGATLLPAADGLPQPIA